MKKLLQKIIRCSATNRIGLLAYWVCGQMPWSRRIYAHAQFVRQTAERERTITAALQCFPQLTVAHGPFKGLQYPSAQSAGSELLPKLLGSYESELHFAIEEMLDKPYTTVVDIGCGEGYYAVGIALRLPNAEVYAFDTDDRAKELCKAMAIVNSVGMRVHIGDFCSAEVLHSLPLGERALILSDCEGYESTLFDERLAGFLTRHDLIVEAHDFVDSSISTAIRQAFARTHQIQSIKSVETKEKAAACQLSELDCFTACEKQFMVSESRPAVMEWLVMTSRV